jgi:hypothetical protein
MDALTPEQNKLYEKICAHLTTLCTQTDFLKRLAKENDWTRDFAQNVVEEYAKFLFLAKVTGQPVCPSPIIDKAWHLHLIHTQDYWGKLCPTILCMELHHAPEQGDEGAKFVAWTHDTLNSHRRYFGTPSKIWTATEQTKIGTILRVAAFLLFGIGLGAFFILFFVSSTWPTALSVASAFLIPALILFLSANISVSKSMCGGSSCSSGCSGGGHSCGGGGH